MNLSQHAAVVWKHRMVMMAGLVIGIALAVLAAFSVPSFERRGSEEWQAESNILVTQKGFPEGRVTLPGDTSATDASGDISPAPSGDGQTFADPARLSSLALLYSVIARSEQVRSKLPGNVAPRQVSAVALDATGNRTTFLPIIRLTTTAASAPAAERLNRSAYAAFRELLENEQREAAITPNERVELNVLDEPSEPLLVTGRSLTSSALAVILALIGAFAVAHLLEGLSLRLKGMSLRPVRGEAGAPAPASPPSKVAAPAAATTSSRSGPRPAGGNGNGHGPMPTEHGVLHGRREHSGTSTRRATQ